MDKRVVDSGRVGERMKEALVDGLNGLSTMLIWEVACLFGFQCVLWDSGDGVQG